MKHVADLRRLIIMALWSFLFTDIALLVIIIYILK